MKCTYSLLLIVLILCCGSIANADVISEIKFSPGPFCALRNGQYVNISFKYKVTTPGGVRIFPRPSTAGAPSPNYGASGSDLYTGQGTGTSSFTITSGDVVVDHVRFELTNAEQTQTILVFYVEAEFHFGANGIYNITVSPLSPA